MMTLYEVWDGENVRVFATLAGAKTHADEMAKATDLKASVDKILLPLPSKALIMNIINEKGYVAARENDVYVAMPPEAPAE